MQNKADMFTVLQGYFVVRTQDQSSLSFLMGPNSRNSKRSQVSSIYLLTCRLKSFYVANYVLRKLHLFNILSICSLE
jgi:hypothetical protein